MWKFPLVRPRFAPGPGERYGPRHLQPLARRLYSRLSRLTGYDLRSILPLRIDQISEQIAEIVRKEPRVKWGFYESSVHAVYRPPLFSTRDFSLSRQAREAAMWLFSRGSRTSLGQHETLHGLSSLLYPLPSSRVSPASPNALHSFEESFASLGQRASSKPELAFLPHLNQVYQKHGQDALLALLVQRNRLRHPGSVQLVLKRLFDKGYLSSKGFTMQGEEWFAKRARRNVANTLRMVRFNRKERGLPGVFTPRKVRVKPAVLQA